MAVTEFKPTSWGDNEPVFTSKLNTMTQNEQWLFENTPRMLYTAYNTKITRSMKIACGILLCRPSGTNVQQHTQTFGTFFSTACKPVVVTSLQHSGEVRFHWGIKGINATYVDSRGFEVLGGADITGKWTRMTKNFWIHWIAMGY